MTPHPREGFRRTIRQSLPMRGPLPHLLMLAVLLSGCAGPQAATGRTAAARPGAEAQDQVATALFFGLSGADGSLVSETQWQRFLDEVVTPRFGGLTAVAQVRVFAPLPWSENFESGRPPFWIGGGGSLAVEDLSGNQVFRKGASRTGIHRHAIYMGPADMSGYTVQVDVLSTQQGRRRPDIGLINSGYTMDLQGNRQKIQIQSWAAELRIKEEVDFTWEPDTWYRLKLRVDIEGDRGIVRGKVWPRDATEPTDWTITAEDPLPNRTGSPGIIGYSPINIYFDNVSVVENE